MPIIKKDIDGIVPACKYVMLNLRFRPFFKYNLMVIFITFSSISAFCQTISGKVFDVKNGKGMSDCNISILGTNRGAITNGNGYYSIKLSPGTYDILFQFIGYKSDTIRIAIKDQPIVKNIALKKQPISAGDIIIFASIYSEAEQLILRAAQEKKKYLGKVKNYSCKSYTKTIIYRKQKTKGLKYVLLLEFYSQIFWNAPDYYYEIIKSQRQSANIPQSINMFSGNSFLNINSDRISLGQKRIVGPTAPDAIKYYYYEIIDTLYQDKDRIFKISIDPKDDSRPLMNGFIYLVDNKFIIQKVDVQLNDQCNYGFYRDIHIIQKYAKEKNKMYLPYYSLNESDWKINIPKYPLLKYRKENFRENYVVNNASDEKYKGRTEIIFKNKIPFKDVPMNIPPLTTSEKKGYSTLDSLVTHRPVLKFVTKAIKLIDLFSYLKKQPIGKFSDFYRFNKVEGNFLGLAFNMKNIFTPFNIYAGFGQGFGDKKRKYFLQLAYNFNTLGFKGKLVLNQFDKIITRENNSELPVWFNTFSSLLDSYDYFDYYYSKGRSAALLLNSSPFRFTTAVFQEYQNGTINHYSNGVWGKNHFIPAMVVKDGQYTGLRIDANYTTAGYRQTPLSKELIQNQSYTEISIRYESAFKKWGSVSNYHKELFLLYLRQNTFFNGFLDLKFYLANASSRLPVQKYFELESGLSGYDRFKTFRTLNLNSFVGDKKIALYCEHNFHNTLFRLTHLPYIKNVPLDFVLVYNLGWAGNNEWNNFKFKDFYSEAGFGIGRIFSILKLEFLWRLKKYGRSNAFAFSIKMSEIEL